MDDQQPEALRLADWIESESPPTEEASCADVAAELRRLHEVEQQRNELLAVLKLALPTLQKLKFEADCSYGSNFSRAQAETNRRNYEAACAAITHVEGVANERS